MKGNGGDGGAWCWTVAAGITTYSGETYDSDYATAQGITPVASGTGTTNARLNCDSAESQFNLALVVPVPLATGVMPCAVA